MPYGSGGRGLRISRCSGVVELGVLRFPVSDSGWGAGLHVEDLRALKLTVEGSKGFSLLELRPGVWWSVALKSIRGLDMHIKDCQH